MCGTHNNERRFQDVNTLVTLRAGKVWRKQQEI